MQVIRQMEFRSIYFLLLIHTFNFIFCADKEATNSLEKQSSKYYSAESNFGEIEDEDRVSEEDVSELSSLVNMNLGSSAAADIKNIENEDGNDGPSDGNLIGGEQFFGKVEAWSVERKILLTGHTMYFLQEYTNKNAAFFEFDSKKVYLIKSGENESWSILLHIGWGTTPDERKAGQEFAMKAYSPLCDTDDFEVEFGRIVEIPEKVLVERLNRSPYAFFNKDELPLYLLMGTDDKVRIEKVPLSLLWLDNKNDYCLVVNIGVDVPVLGPIIYCSPSSNDILKLKAKKLGLEQLSLLETNYLGFSITFITQKPETEDRELWNESWETLYKVLETDGLPENELAALNERLQSITGKTFVGQRDEAVSLFKINNDSVEWEEILERPLQFDILNDDGCFVLDSASYAGILVVIGKNTDLNTRISAARKAEEIVTNKYPLETEIEIMKHGEEKVDLKIHFENWPYNRFVAENNMNLTSDNFIKEVSNTPVSRRQISIYSVSDDEDLVTSNHSSD